MAKPRNKTYILADERAGMSTLIKTGKKGTLTIFDPNYGPNGSRRAIRHCPNQKSIFIDEQDKHALVEPIIFEYGLLEVSAENPITQEFLDKHPSNSANSDGEGWFMEINEEEEARESIKEDELRIDIMHAVKQMAKSENGIHELSAVVSVMLGNVNEASQMGIEQLKRVIYNEIESNPRYFADENGNVTIFEDDDIKRKYIILRALKEHIIKKSSNGRSMLWSKDGAVIATAPRSIELVDYFSDFLTTDEGVLVAEEIARRS
jgi:hypothetical protein